MAEVIEIYMADLFMVFIRSRLLIFKNIFSKETKFHGKMADFDPRKSSEEDRDPDSDSGNTSEEEMSDEIRCKKPDENYSDKPNPGRPTSTPSGPTAEPRAETETELTFKNFLLRRVLPGAAIGVTAIVAAPLALGAIGFGAGGIVGGSYAAGMMSSAAIANGGGVAAGSLVAVLQSAGAAGISAAANAGIFTAVTTTATGVVEACSRNKDKVQENMNDDRRNNLM